LPLSASGNRFGGALVSVEEPKPKTCTADYVSVDRNVEAQILDGSGRHVALAPPFQLNFGTVDTPGTTIAWTKNSPFTPKGQMYFSVPSGALRFWAVPEEDLRVRRPPPLAVRSGQVGRYATTEATGVNRVPVQDKRQEPVRVVSAPDLPVKEVVIPAPPCATTIRPESMNASRTVVFSGGNAGRLFSKYLGEAKARQVTVRLSTLTVVIFKENAGKLEPIEILPPQLSTVQKMKDKYEEKWLEQLSGLSAAHLPDPIKDAEKYSVLSDVVCGR
jgi:hypothetical protein